LSVEDSQHHSAAEDLLRAVSGPVRPVDEAVEVAKTLEADEAVRVLRRIRQQHPQSIEAHVALADALQRRGDDRRAEAEYRDLGRARSEDPRVAFGLGRALLNLEDYTAALAAFDAAATLGQDGGELHARRGETLMRLGRYPEAVRAYRQALRSNMENTVWRLNLGIALAASDPRNRREAEQRFREVLAMDSGNERAWEELHKLGARF
jgi:Flp pilus assembly protein TadD